VRLEGKAVSAVTLVHATAAEVHDDSYHDSLSEPNTVKHEVSVDSARAFVHLERSVVWKRWALHAVYGDRDAERIRMGVACILDRPTVRSCDDFAAKGGDAAAVRAHVLGRAAGMHTPCPHHDVSAAQAVAGSGVAID